MTERRKRPYKPPSIRSEKVFERRALACGKLLPVKPQVRPVCHGKYKVS